MSNHSKKDPKMTAVALSAQTPREARFWDKIAPKYAAKPVPDEAIYAEKLRIVRSHLTPDSTVFEFGCGTGSTAVALAPFSHCIIATDVSAKMIEIARDKAEAANLTNLRFERATLEDYAPDSGSVDMVLGMSILHLLVDRKSAMRSAYRMLKPGGVFISSTACIADRMAWFGLIAPVGKLFGLIPHVAIFRTKTLVREIEEAGFTIERRWQPEKSGTAFLVACKPE